MAEFGQMFRRLAEESGGELSSVAQAAGESKERSVGMRRLAIATLKGGKKVRKALVGAGKAGTKLVERMRRDGSAEEEELGRMLGGVGGAWRGVVVGDLCEGFVELENVVAALGSVRRERADVFATLVVARVAETVRGLDEGRAHIGAVVDGRVKVLEERVDAFVKDAIGARKAVRKCAKRLERTGASGVSARSEYEDLVLECYHVEQSLLYAANELERITAEVATEAAILVRTAYVALVDGLHAYFVTRNTAYGDASALLALSFPRWEHLCGAAVDIPPAVASTITAPASSAHLLPDGFQVMAESFPTFVAPPSAGAAAMAAAAAAAAAAAGADASAAASLTSETFESDSASDAGPSARTSAAGAEPTFVPVVALYPMTGTSPDELSFAVGETLMWDGSAVDGWGYAMQPSTAREGYFPLNYVDGTENVVVREYSSFDFPDVTQHDASPPASPSPAPASTPAFIPPPIANPPTPPPMPSSSASASGPPEPPPPLYSAIYPHGRPPASTTPARTRPSFRIEIPDAAAVAEMPEAPATPPVSASNRSARAALIREIQRARLDRLAARSPRAHHAAAPSAPPVAEEPPALAPGSGESLFDQIRRGHTLRPVVLPEPPRTHLGNQMWIRDQLAAVLSRPPNLDDAYRPASPPPARLVLDPAPGAAVSLTEQIRASSVSSLRPVNHAARAEQRLRTAREAGPIGGPRYPFAFPDSGSSSGGGWSDDDW